MNNIEIDWHYLLERLESLMDAGEEFLSRQLAEYEPDPDVFREKIAFRWHRLDNSGLIEYIETPDIADPDDLLGIDGILRRLKQNTLQFVRGFPSNNILLWGERGNGKSAAIKSMLKVFAGDGLRMVEVHKDDLFQLPHITAWLRNLPFRFILFCDDLAFDEAETSYRELKALLEGGLEVCPENIRVYATSNRRHQMPETLRNGELHPEEATSEKLSFSDRFGISLGFSAMKKETYLAILHHMAGQRQLKIPAAELEQQGLQWAQARGAQSGRVAKQFIDDLTGRLAVESQTKT